MPSYRHNIAGRTAVYRTYSADGELLYVGVTRNPIGRFSQHKYQKYWWDCCVKRVEMEWYDTRIDAFRAERLAIRHENPIHNVSRPMVEESDGAH